MNIKKFFLSMLITILVLVFIGGGLLLAKVMFGTTLSGEISKLLDKNTATEKANILLLGLDKDRIRADVIMVVSLDPEDNDIQVLSIPRDTRVQYPSGRFDKINHAMGYKNPEETIIGLVKEITGMPIHYYCEVNFQGFRDVIDILGGVEYNVPIDMHYDDPYQDLHIHVNKGLQVLDGKDAEGVVRYRATYANGDLGRINLQQDFLRELFAQKLQPQYISKAPALLQAMNEHVTTNFSIAEATKYLGMLKEMSSESLQTHMLPGASKTISGASYYVYNEEETRQMILTSFGYPEEEAEKLEQQSQGE